jgi:hypothetical protein
MKKCLNCGFVFVHPKRVPIDYGPGVAMMYCGPNGENWPCTDACPQCGSDAITSIAPSTTTSVSTQYASR